MEEFKLFELNKPAFREIFLKKLVEQDAKFITQKHFFRFLCELKIFPDLLSAITLKQLLMEISSKKKGEISESTFYKLIKSISEICFPGQDPLKSLLLSIKSKCREVYQVYLITKPVNPVKIRKNAKPYPENREVSTQRKILNKSTSQKLSLSGLISPKNSTMVLKKFPSLKSPRNPVKPAKEPEKLQRILEVLQKFKEKSEKIRSFQSETEQSKKIFRFIEQYLQNSMRSVIET